MPQRRCLVLYDPVTSSDRLNEGIAMVNQNKSLSGVFSSKRDKLWLGQWGASVVWPGDSPAL